MFMGAEYYNRNEVASTTVMLDTMTMIVMEDFKSRLRTTRKAAGMSQAGLGKLVGMSQSGISALESGRNRSTSAIPLLALALGVEALWLAKGRGSKYKNANVDVDAVPSNLVPVVPWGLIGQVLDMTTIDAYLPCPVEHGQRTYVLRVRGHAMCATHGRRSFQEGDVIFVDPDRPAGNESFVIVRLSANSEPIFRQLLIEDGGCQYLRALNPAWPEPITRLDGGHRIEGTVIFKGEALI